MRLAGFTKLLEVNASDTIGTALIKKATGGYLKGVLAAGVGLGALAIGVKVLSDKAEVDSEETEESVEDEVNVNDELEENWKKIEKIINDDYETVESV